ncbi:uncharacterized protein BDCG_17969 [Blastomyces dermatitidis ER-3]|uniref:Uncharacterized protein n=1 Tax=Ajellomyces dermatitidis (strain ER-3 / ATCC MYA-2586) TaxID=559297 RepID=A0ABX2W1D0_AJEDR|nr:uncharacterized protein BDCG_17969 [Blastomyces dermatitidis ER-3]EQL30965.1 hypothetical protein BDFG_06600 [Blastomyces dermatitidis ATCC 26199]OAT03182.1 hypothetical protein BDCG_17969 [Blastomyces dermatitidis ER-3]
MTQRNSSSRRLGQPPFFILLNVLYYSTFNTLTISISIFIFIYPRTPDQNRTNFVLLAS